MRSRWNHCARVATMTIAAVLVFSAALYGQTYTDIFNFDGPHGWEHVATRLGTTTPCRSAEGMATVCVPDVVLLLEVRVDFSLPWSAIEVFERGAPVLDTAAADAAARELALAEDRITFYGWRRVPDLQGIAARRDPRLGASRCGRRRSGQGRGHARHQRHPGPLRGGPVAGTLLRVSTGRRRQRLSGGATAP